MNIENFDLDALLDGTLDDLADIPEFKPFPAGTHLCTMTLVQKEIAKKPGFELGLKSIETKELANPQEDIPLTEGSTTNIGFMLDNEFGQGGLKMVLAAAAAKFGKKSNRELIEECQNAEVFVVTNLRSNKEKTQKYTNLVEILFT